MNNVVQLKPQGKTTLKNTKTEPSDDLKALARHLGRMAAKDFFESNQSDEPEMDSKEKTAVDTSAATGV